MLKDKKVGVEHLIYIIIIFTILISFSLVIHFGEVKNAGNIVGVASTVSSIILAVIAIVMSLIDVAGQKQSVVDLKDTAESLAETNTQSQEFLQDVIAKLDEINTLRDMLVEQMNENESWRKEIKQIISEKDEGKENSEKILKELQSKVESEPTIVKYGLAELAGKSNMVIGVGNNYGRIFDIRKAKQVEDFIRDEYKTGETENYSILLDKISMEFGNLSKKDIINSLTVLDSQRKIYIISGSKSEKTVYIN